MSKRCCCLDFLVGRCGAGAGGLAPLLPVSRSGARMTDDWRLGHSR